MSDAINDTVALDHVPTVWPIWARLVATVAGFGAVTVAVCLLAPLVGSTQISLTRAFDRSILVLVMPVGTGWVDPAGIDTLEYLYAGDVASVAVQYSYLTSWLSLVIEPEYGTDTARALFETVYEYWTALPRDSRPRSSREARRASVAG